MTRPKLPEDKKKSFMLRVRMTKAEEEKLRQISDGDMSGWVRKTIRNSRVNSLK